MSFFNKISQYEDFELDDKTMLINSIAQQLEILFSNRNDKYYVYDFANKEIIAIHEVFQLNYLLPEFSRKLVQVIQAFDSRMKNTVVSVVKTQMGMKIMISSNAIMQDKLIKIPDMSYMI